MDEFDKFEEQFENQTNEKKNPLSAINEQYTSYMKDF